MREAYRSDLRHLVEDLVAMLDRVHEGLGGASTALLDGDLALAERVIAADSHIDEDQAQLDETMIQLLARQGPVAGDLRLLVAGLRMSSTIERMGDLAAHIAIVARRSHPQLAVPERHREDFQRLGELALGAVGSSARVISGNDLALAAQVEKDDDEIDALQSDIYRAVTRHDDYTSAEVMNLTLLGRYYERIGDHAVSLVRRVGFLVTGDTLDSHGGREDPEEF
ncbi:phosphate transport system regulatory protein PhoU [Brachybacterium endophyticum]|uniref:Phosphate-specific transport system accessory protein PhoU n=1 Tax=Brachybacterium endophyticum TaxID=2182385 RepID=A0A2U2RLB3_9MICO|nr:phosphate signaling complex protein PhoU [Brachybacterium endophyticum]PWH06668.1 phosphate transport system regulatory protein PhoU [Brachybacterium endophyticum]